MLYGVIVVIQSLVAIQLMTACVYISPTQDLAYVLATGYGPSSKAWLSRDLSLASAHCFMT